MKTQVHKPSKASPGRDRLAFLEEAYRQTLESLEMAASLGIPEGVKPLGTVTQILDETALRLRKLLKFKAVAFFLVREPGGDFYLARCSPPGRARQMEEEMRLLVESGSAAWALQRKRPVFTSPGNMEGQLLMHSMATASRIRGMFLGWLGQDIKSISDTSLTLLTILLRGSTSLLEGVELYGLFRKANSELKAKVRDLEESQRSLKREIEHRRKVEEQLKHQALHDPLTGLANRTLMRDRIQQAVRRSQRHDAVCYAVAFMDLDKFKLVNDTLGHDAGDKLLVHVGERIIESVRQLDTVARFGGDEFVIFLEELSSPSEAIRVMKRVRQNLARPFEIDGHNVTVTGSFGLVFGPVRLSNPDVLIKRANVAMHMAKEAGRNRIKVFSARLSGKAKLNAALLTGLARAVASGSTGVLYVPTLSSRDLRLSGFLAVPTWKAKGIGELRDEELVELAAKEGLAWNLWLLTLFKALDGLKDRLGQAEPSLAVTMKLRQAQLPPPGLAVLARDVLERLGQAELPGFVLRLEIPEDTLVAGGEHLVQELTRLKGQGVRLSVGDFGERFFSFHGVGPALFESVSIDSSKLTAQPAKRSKELMGSLMSIAKALDLSVVAEGVDSTETADIIANLNCLGMQGESLLRPLTAEQALRFIRNTNVCAVPPSDTDGTRES
jgi:diguanylate cyclase (GGDEF)-like protein